MHGTNQQLPRNLQVLLSPDREEAAQKEVDEIPMPRSVIKKVNRQ
jgi:hypothetical protein